MPVVCEFGILTNSPALRDLAAREAAPISFSPAGEPSVELTTPPALPAKTFGKPNSGGPKRAREAAPINFSPTQKSPMESPPPALPAKTFGKPNICGEGSGECDAPSGSQHRRRGDSGPSKPEDIKQSTSASDNGGISGMALPGFTVLCGVSVFAVVFPLLLGA